ncbi:MAG: hypothetical protein AB7O91_09490 [Sphingomonas sp.]
MQDPTPLLTLATAGLAATGMTAVAALRGWQEWLDLRRDEIETRCSESPQRTISELRQRVRRLEAIADGAKR